MAEKREATEYSKTVGNVIFGLYKAKRWNQEKLSAKTGITLGTLRRMVAGESEIPARELIVIAGALGTTAGAILDTALSEYGGLDTLVNESVARLEPVSDAPANVTSIGKRVEDMTSDELDNPRMDNAAHPLDEEADADETD